MKKKLSRREFILGLASVLGGATLAQIFGRSSRAQALLGQKKYLPIVSRGLNFAPPTSTPIPTPTRAPTKIPGVLPALPAESRVIHVHASGATNWTSPNTQKFYEHVNQGVADRMVERGLKDLTGAGDWAGIWDYLFRRIDANGYQAGQKIAIKVNLNYGTWTENDGSKNNCAGHNNRIDALPQPVISLLKGLKSIGVAMSNVTIYDATGTLHFQNPSTGRQFYPFFRNAFAAEGVGGVRLVGDPGSCGDVTQATYGKDASLTVRFQQAGQGLKERKLADVLYDCDYLINMPILKNHDNGGGTGVTLGFKNHMGSIHYVYANDANDSLHEWFNASGLHHSVTYNPMVDVYLNPNIGCKTVLVMGDGLFGSLFNTDATNYWNVFKGPANSLFFAVDPVAIDCVMADVLRAEGAHGSNKAYEYLFLAEKAGLGRMEGSLASPGSNPFTGKYGTIRYSRVEA